MKFTYIDLLELSDGFPPSEINPDYDHEQYIVHLAYIAVMLLAKMSDDGEDIDGVLDIIQMKMGS